MRGALVFEQGLDQSLKLCDSFPEVFAVIDDSIALRILLIYTPRATGKAFSTCGGVFVVDAFDLATATYLDQYCFKTFPKGKEEHQRRRSVSSIFARRRLNGKESHGDLHSKQLWVPLRILLRMPPSRTRLLSGVAERAMVYRAKPRRNPGQEFVKWYRWKND